VTYSLRFANPDHSQAHGVGGHDVLTPADIAADPAGAATTAQAAAVATAAGDATTKANAAQAAAAATAAADATAKVAAEAAIARAAEAAINVATIGAISPAQVDTKISAERVTERANQSSTYLRMDSVTVGLDADGEPYWADGIPFADAIPIHADADGVPYLTI